MVKEGELEYILYIRKLPTKVNVGNLSARILIDTGSAVFLNATDSCDELRMKRLDLLLDQAEMKRPRIVGRIWIPSEDEEVKCEQKLHELILGRELLRGCGVQQKSYPHPALTVEAV